MVSEVPIFAATPALRGALSADAEEGERQLPYYPRASLAARSRPRCGAIRIAAGIAQDHKSSLMPLKNGWASWDFGRSIQKYRCI